jgi:hypothetical protein
MRDRLSPRNPATAARLGRLVAWAVDWPTDALTVSEHRKVLRAQHPGMTVKSHRRTVRCEGEAFYVTLYTVRNPNDRPARPCK